MWIDNYDDPEEMRLDEALELLKQNGFKDVTDEANKQNKRTDFKAFEGPTEHGGGVHYCELEQDVIDLAIDYQLEYQP